MGAAIKNDHLEPVRRQLLAAALFHIPFDGWSAISLNKAARDCGMESGMAKLAFPGGAKDLLSCFVAECDLAMLAALRDAKLDEMRIRDRIKTAVKARIDAIGQHAEAERRALSFLALPQNASMGFGFVAQTVDLMWRAAGDTSTDFNFYTKRGLLAGVYSATLLYWLNDTSEENQATWAFLDRRIDDVMQIEKTKAKVFKATKNMPSPISLLARLRYPGESRMKP
ncbi:MAG: COQ9 family protein [Alphaproteobacteria bacterium]